MRVTSVLVDSSAAQLAKTMESTRVVSRDFVVDINAVLSFEQSDSEKEIRLFIMGRVLICEIIENSKRFNSRILWSF